MKTTVNYKYIEWRDTEGLHEDVLQSLSDLTFLKDELQFLKDLVAEHTLELIYEKSSEQSKLLFSQLQEYTRWLEKLIKELQAHKNNLQILTDTIDIPGELQEYKEEHYRLILEESNFHADLKKIKQNIFDVLTGIMKKNRQKRLM